MDTLIKYVTENGETILLGLAAAHAAAVAITNLTPTPKDDAFVRKAYRLVEVLAGLITKKAKQ